MTRTAHRHLVRAATLTATLGVASPALALPAWVDGKDGRYTRDEYLVGVGKGPDRKAADIDARAEIARIFESKIVAVLQDFQAAATAVTSSGKGVSVEVQKISSFQQVTTEKTLSSIQLAEHAAEGGTHYTLALLDREQCKTSLEEQIQGIDAKIQAALGRADEGDKLGAFKAYGAAMNLMDEREGLNAMLRVCALSGKGVPPPIELGELRSKFEEASGELKIGIDLQGSGAARVRDCLMEQLGNKGYQLKEIAVDDEDSEEEEEEDEDGSGGFDAILKGKLKSEADGEIAGSKMVRTELVLKLVNAKTKKVLKTVTASRKEGRPSVKASAALSAYKICQKEMPNLVKEIDKHFKR
ncbi:LPP20 family lipoprotein [Myxococcota bacterium]|nr:LPP20 family lipoprotein [Myxococcota bacterium]